jgi:hypothetical protein
MGGICTIQMVAMNMCQLAEAQDKPANPIDEMIDDESTQTQPVTGRGTPAYVPPVPTTRKSGLIIGLEVDSYSTDLIDQDVLPNVPGSSNSYDPPGICTTCTSDSETQYQGLDIAGTSDTGDTGQEVAAPVASDESTGSESSASYMESSLESAVVAKLGWRAVLDESFDMDVFVNLGVAIFHRPSELPMREGSQADAFVFGLGAEPILYLGGTGAFLSASLGLRAYVMGDGINCMDAKRCINTENGDENQYFWQWRTALGAGYGFGIFSVSAKGFYEGALRRIEVQNVDSWMGVNTFGAALEAEFEIPIF